jgi:hypothetical protein
MHSENLTKGLLSTIFDFGIICVTYKLERINLYGSKIFSPGKRCDYLQP